MARSSGTELVASFRGPRPDHFRRRLVFRILFKRTDDTSLYLYGISATLAVVTLIVRLIKARQSPSGAPSVHVDQNGSKDTRSSTTRATL